MTKMPFNLSTSGLVKTLIIIGVSAKNILNPKLNFVDQSVSDYYTLIVAIALFALIIPVQAVIYSFVLDVKLERPNWNQNFFKTRRILGLLHFVGFLLLFAGISSIFGVALNKGELSADGIASFGVSIGILTGVALSVFLWTKKEITTHDKS